MIVDYYRQFFLYWFSDFSIGGREDSRGVLYCGLNIDPHMTPMHFNFPEWGYAWILLNENVNFSAQVVIILFFVFLREYHFSVIRQTVHLLKLWVTQLTLSCNKPDSQVVFFNFRCTYALFRVLCIYTCVILF